MITNLNEVYRQLAGFGLINVRAGKKLPKHQRGKIQVTNEEKINDPLPLPKPPPKQLPSKPSRTPPPAKYDSSDDSSSSSDDED